MIPRLQLRPHRFRPLVDGAFLRLPMLLTSGEEGFILRVQLLFHDLLTGQLRLFGHTSRCLLLMLSQELLRLHPSLQAMLCVVE